MNSSDLPGDMLRDFFHIEEIDGQQFLVSKETGQISSLNQNAGIMTSLFRAGFGVDEAARLIAEEAHLPIRIAQQQLNEFVNLLAGQCRHATETREQRVSLFNEEIAGNNSYTSIFKLEGTWFSVEFPSKAVFAPIDALFSNFAMVSLPDGQPCIKIMVKTGFGTYGVFIEGELLDTTPDMRGVDGILRGIFIKNAYPDAEHLILLHASCISFAGRAMIFAGASGSGKSMLALTLSHRGYGYFGDDTVGVNLAEGSALAFPTNISVKQATWPLLECDFPEIRSADTYGAPTKTMKLIAPAKKSLAGNRIASISGLVFIRYGKGCECSFGPLELTSTLKMLDESGAVFHPDDIARSPRQLLTWLKQTPCFALQYPDVDSLVSMLREQALI